MKKVLITGGNGFVGSRLTKELLSLGLDIVTIGRNKNEDIVLDLCDNLLPEKLKEVNPNIICHLASGSNIQRANEDPDSEYKDVVLGTKNLIKSIKESNLRIQNFIYLSTQAVYGECVSPITEGMALTPESTYGEYKLEAEKIIINSELPYVILRVSSVFGPGQLKSGVISNFLSKLELNKPPIVFNGLDNFIDLIYVDDVVKCVGEIIESEKLENEILNVSSGMPITLAEIVDELYKYFPEAQKPIIEQNQTYNFKNKGRYLSANKLKSKINWECQYNIVEGIKKVIESRKRIKA